MEAIEIKETNGCRISVYHDYDAECPTSWDNAGKYLFEYRDSHVLSPESNWKSVFGEYSSGRKSLHEALQELVYDYVKWEDLREYFKSEVDEEYFDDGNYTYELTENLDNSQLIEALNEIGSDIVVVEEVSIGYCQGDYVPIVGFCTKRHYAKYVKEPQDDWKEDCRKFMRDEIKEIGMWLWGDVKLYELERKVRGKKICENGREEDFEEWEEVETIGGFFMEADELIKYVMDEYNLQES